MLGGGPSPFGVIVENKILFYQAASELPEGLSLADYEYRFYKDNAGKELLTVASGGSAGQVLVKDSGTDFDASWRFGYGAKVDSGSWHNSGNREANSGSQPSQNQLRLAPWFFAQPVVLNALGIRIGTSGTGSAGAVYRLGVYDSTSEGLPGARLLDAGTVDVTQPAGTVLTITGLSLSLDAGEYWIGGALQGDPATAPFIVGNSFPYARIISSVNQTADTPTGGATDAIQSFGQSFVSGELPSTLTAVPFGTVAPLVFARFN
jgi:hypothetical protein